MPLQREIVVHAGNGLHQRAVAIFSPSRYSVLKRPVLEVPYCAVRCPDLLRCSMAYLTATSAHAHIARRITMQIAHKGQHMFISPSTGVMNSSNASAKSVVIICASVRNLMLQDDLLLPVCHSINTQSFALQPTLYPL